MQMISKSFKFLRKDGFALTMLSDSLEKNISYIKSRLADCDDIIMRDFFIGRDNSIRLFMLYTDNIVSSRVIEESILTNLMNRAKISVSPDIIESIAKEAVSVGEIEETREFEKLFTSVLLGDTAILAENNGKALIVSSKGWPTRGVGTTENEVAIQGPKDAFCESGSINLVLVRRRIRDTRLKVKKQKIGRRSKTDVSLLYMEDVIRETTLSGIKRRLENIDIDAVLDAGALEQLTEKNTWSLFPQLQITERPDKAASAVLEGRAVLLVDNSPFAVLLPATLNVFFQAAEDYYERWEIMSLIRFLRYATAFLAVTLPGFYIAFTLYHPEMLPAELALKIALTRAGVPFPAIAELMIMELSFELLREAAIRLPSPVGSSIGIVGGIIIGQAAVDAGLVGPVIIMVSAATAICTFVIPGPSFVSGIRLSKYIVLVFAAMFGLFGVWVSLLLLLTHLCSLQSFGIPYLFPFCSGSVNNDDDLKDSIVRLPLFMIKKRPVFAKKSERIKQK